MKALMKLDRLILIFCCAWATTANAQRPASHAPLTRDPTYDCNDVRITQILTLNELPPFYDVANTGNFQCVDSRGVTYAGTFDAHVYLVDETTTNTLDIVECGSLCDWDGTAYWEGSVRANGEPYHCFRGYSSAISNLMYESHEITPEECAGGPPSCNLAMSTSGGGATSTTSNWYTCGSLMQFSAVDGGGWEFVSWSGDYSSTDRTITFVLNRDMAITANFNWNPQYPPASEGPGGDNFCGAPPPGQGQCVSPILFNLGSGGYDLTGLDDSVRFDLDADGIAESVAWTSRGSQVAFLALDRNANGRIDGGAELFGNRTPLPSQHAAADGFEAMASLDSNHDGVLDARDEAWLALRLWIDADHDGISEPSELFGLVDVGMTEIQLSPRSVGRRDRHGNVFRYESHYTRQGQSRPYYDVYLVTAP